MTIRDLARHPVRHITVQEYADYLHVPARNIYHWIDKGALHAVKLEGIIRIPIAEARKFAAIPVRTF
jgi:excisionase family DNA binding protein